MRAKVGEWLEQKATGAFALVIEVRANGKIRVITFNTFNGTTLAGRAVSSFCQHWFPVPVVVPMEDVPEKVRAKILIKKERMEWK